MNKDKRKRLRAEREAAKAAEPNTAAESSTSTLEGRELKAEDIVTEKGELDSVALQQHFYGDNPYHFKGDFLFCGARRVAHISVVSPGNHEMALINKRLSQLRQSKAEREYGDTGIVKPKPGDLTK